MSEEIEKHDYRPTSGALDGSAVCADCGGRRAEGVHRRIAEGLIVDDAAQNVIEAHDLANQVPPTPEGSELAEVQALIAENDRRLQMLAKVHRVGIPKDDMVRIQLSALLEHLYGDETDMRRLKFERFLAGCIKKIIDEAEGNVTRATLLAGVNGSGLQLPVEPPRKRRER